MSDQSKQNVQLIEQFLSSDFLKNIWSVVWEIDLKWFYLPTEKRDEYRREVVCGWVGFLNGSSNDILSHEVAKDRINIDHHLDEVKKRISHRAPSVKRIYWVLDKTIYLL